MCSRQPHAQGCAETDKPPYYSCVCGVGYQCTFCNLSASQCNEDSSYCLMKNTERCIPQKDKNSCQRPTCLCKGTFGGSDCSVCQEGYRCKYCNLTTSPCNEDMPYCIKANTLKCISDANGDGGCKRPTCVCKPGTQCEAPTCIEHGTFNNSASQCLNTCLTPYASDSCPVTETTATCMCNLAPKRYVYDEGRCVPYPEGCDTLKAKDQ